MTSKVSQGLFRLDTKDTFRRVVDDLRAARMGLLYGTVTYDTASLVDAAGATAAVNVPGAEVGDFAFASLGLDAQDILVTAYVAAADVVEVRIQNEGAATVDLASTTIRAFVVPRRSIRNVFGPNALFASAAVDVTSLIDAAGATQSLTVTGAALGDYAFFSHGVDLLDITATAYVSAADTIEVRFQNESGSTHDLASATMRGVVIPAGSLADAFGGVVKTGAAVYDPASLGDGVGATAEVTVAGAALGDYAFVSFSLDLQDITVTAYVSAPDKVQVRFQNESTGTVNLASGTLRVGVIPQGYIAAAASVALQK